MRHATDCKFCHKPIFIEIDDAYSKLGDPLKLIQLAACNSCADLRVERRVLERKIQLACRCMELAGQKATRQDRGQWDAKLVALTQSYAKMIARWNGMCGMTWDQAIVELMLDKPTEWAHILGQMWKAFKVVNHEFSPGN